MPFLALNGVEIPVRAEGFTRKEIVIGEASRSFSGAYRRDERARKFEWTGKTPPLSATEARATRGLLTGQGHSWTFDTDLYSTAKGLGSTATSGTVTAAVASGKFSNKVTLAASATLDYTPFTIVSTFWTAMFWRLETATWHNYIITGDGTKWKNGVTSVASTSAFFSQTGTYFRLLGGASGESIDDLAIVPYVVPATWAETWGVAASAFPDLPKLTLTGDAIAGVNTSASVMGEVESVDQVAATVGGTWASNAEVITFKLCEV